MGKVNFVKQLQNIDMYAYNAIIELLQLKGITELDISNPDDEYDDVYVYCYNDDCHSADNIKLNKIIFSEGLLLFVDEKGNRYLKQNFHIGTMPYIHNIVEWLTSNMPDKPQTKKYTVSLYYHGCFSITVDAVSEEEAYDIAQEKVQNLSDLEFLDAIDCAQSGKDIYEEK